MHSMEIDRRRFLGWLAAVGAGAAASSGAWAAASGADSAFYLAARKSPEGYQATVIDGQGHLQLAVPMPARGHSFAIDAARGRAVVFGRQPGFFAVVFDTGGKAPPRTIVPPEGRHFFGHGVFSPDGKRLFATENDYDAGRGVLGIYDASEAGACRRIGEFSTGGIGPHEVVLMPDGRTLCVANGGILTHPDYGKLTLNAADMEPSLAYIDMATGDLLEQHRLAPSLHRLSIRHLVLDGSGAVWFGCQHTGPAQEQPPLVGRHRRGTAPELFAGPASVLRDMRNYVGSLACDVSGTRVATSSPVGGCIVVWDAATGKFLERIALFDGCGVAPRRQGGFVLTSGQGEVAHALPGDGQAVRQSLSSGVAWDNHLRRV
jgi:hypothetical protein